MALLWCYGSAVWVSNKQLLSILDFRSGSGSDPVQKLGPPKIPGSATLNHFVCHMSWHCYGGMDLFAGSVLTKILDPDPVLTLHKN